MVAERVADRRRDPIVALIGILGDHVAGIVDDVFIIADAADHGVGAATAIDPIVAGGAGEHVDAGVTPYVVVEAVPGAVDCADRTRHIQLLHVGTQQVAGASREIDLVSALVGEFGHHIAGVSDPVVIITDATDHGVGAAVAKEVVVAAAASENIDVVISADGVVQAIAGAIDGADRIRHVQVLQVGTQHIAGASLEIDRVSALASGFDDHVAGHVEVVRIIADAADHGVGATPAIEVVVTAAAGEGVDVVISVDVVVQAIAGAIDGADRTTHIQILHVGTQRVAGASLVIDRVSAFVGGFRDHVGGHVDVILIIAGAADQGVGEKPNAARAVLAVEGVVAATAVDDVAPGIAVDDVVETIAGAVADVDPAAAVVFERQVFDVGVQRIIALLRVHPIGALAEAFSITLSSALST